MDENVLISSLSAGEIAEILMCRLEFEGIESITLDQARRLDGHVHDLLRDLEDPQ